MEQSEEPWEPARGGPRERDWSISETEHLRNRKGVLGQVLSRSNLRMRRFGGSWHSGAAGERIGHVLELEGLNVRCEAAVF